MANDDVVDDAVVRVSPDLTGFRKKLDAALKKEMTPPPTAKVKVDTEQVEKEAKAAAKATDDYYKQIRKRVTLYQNGLKETQKAERERIEQNKKFIATVSSGAKKLAADAKKLEEDREAAAKRREREADARLGNELKRIGKQFDAQRAGEKATQKAAEDRRRAEDAEFEARLRRQDEEYKAFKKRQADAKAEAARQTQESIKRQRADEQYLAFNNRINAELAKNRRESAAEQLRTAHDTHDRIEAIEREGVRQRLTLLGELDKIEKAALREVEKAEKASLDRRSSRVTSAKSALSKLKPPKIIDLGGEGFKPMNLLMAGVLSLTPALLAMASSAAQASTSIAALGAAGIGAGLAMTSLLVSFTPVIQAFKLAQTVDIQKTVSAQKASVKLGKQAATTAEDRAAALRDMAGAQRDLTSATRDEKDAYAAIHTARQQAIRDLDDLRQSVIDLNNQYRSDALSVREAEQQERNTNANFFASALERARAHQDTLDARTRLQDTALERKQKTQDLAKSLKSGIERSDPVLAAKEKARDARNRRLDAQDRLANTKASQTKKAINDTFGAGTDAITSTEEQLKRLRKQMSPAQRELLDFLVQSQDLFKSFGRTMSQATLPGFTKFLKLVALPPKKGKSTLQILSEYAGELGGKLGKAAADFGAFTRSPLFRDDMAKIQKNNAAALETLGKAANTFLKPVLRILTAASPLLGPLSDKLLELATRFDKFIAGAEKSGELEEFFKRTKTEAKKWYDIFSNVFTLLKNIFTQSLPAGGGLVDRFAKFTDQLAKWSESPQGQKQIKAFFDTLGSLPYGDIAKMLVQLGTTFAVVQAAKWAAINPFMTALGLLATQHPDLLARAMTDVASAVVTITEAATAHPEAAAFLIAAAGVLKYSKGARSIAFKLSGLEGIKNFLTGKIPWLEKFTRTATMNVTAGTVIIGGKGVGGGTTVGGGGVGPDGKPKGKFSVGKGAAASGIVIGSVIGEALVSQMSDKGSEFNKGLKEGLQAIFAGAGLGAMFGPEGAAVGAAAGAGILLGNLATAKSRERLKTAQGREGFAFDFLKTDINQLQTHNEGLPLMLSLKDATNRKAVQDYIAARKASVAAATEEVRASSGVAAAKAYEIWQLKESKRVLSDMLQKYGVAKDKADDFAGAATGLTLKLSEQKVEQDKLRNKLDKTTAAADGTKKKFIELHDEIDKVTGERTITVEVDGEEKAFADLQTALQYQLALQQTDKTRNTLNRLGIDPDTGNPIQRTTPTPKKTNKKKVTRKADGGRIPGFSPHPKADNIPAMLTADEFVQPVSAVKYYGTEFMEAVRSKRLPRYASGGQVWPYKVPMPKDIVPIIGVPGTPYTGKIPKGLGDVRGLTAQMMAAVQDLKAHFPQMSVNSGIRTGQAGITVTGNKSYHNYGRAADLIPPNMAAFNYLAAKYGKVAREIIYSPANERQIWNGKPHLYSSKVRAGHFDHIHLALKDGGLVRSFDSGGVLPPGYTLAFNGTGKNETVRTKQQDQQGPVRIDRRDLQMLAAAATAGTTTVSMDGRRVAELTNRYNYLPAGV